MTIQDILGYSSLLKSMSFSRSLKYSMKEFKMKKDFVSLLSKVIMELSLKMLSSGHFVKKIVFSTTFIQREHLKKMGYLKGKIELYKRWLEPCSMKTHFLSTSKHKR